MLETSTLRTTELVPHSSKVVKRLQPQKVALESCSWEQLWAHWPRVLLFLSVPPSGHNKYFSLRVKVEFVLGTYDIIIMTFLSLPLKEIRMVSAGSPESRTPAHWTKPFNNHSNPLGKLGCFVSQMLRGRQHLCKLSTLLLENHPVVYNIKQLQGLMLQKDALIYLQRETPLLKGEKQE